MLIHVHPLADGFKADAKLSDTVTYSQLIKKVARDIVSKSKMSHVIAESLRDLDRCLVKKNITRWSSELFMIRSVLKLSDNDFKRIRASMRCKTPLEREAKAKFTLTKVERDMLEELQNLLKVFEFVTNNLQSNKVNISECIHAFKCLKTN
jgi:hypothetical protein